MENNLENKLLELKGQFVSDYYSLHEFMAHPVLYELCQNFGEIARQEIQLYENVLGRPLIDVEKRYIRGFRSTERIHTLYRALVQLQKVEHEELAIPILNPEQIHNFLIDWYKVHNLEINR